MVSQLEEYFLVIIPSPFFCQSFLPQPRLAAMAGDITVFVDKLGLSLPMGSHVIYYAGRQKRYGRLHSATNKPGFVNVVRLFPLSPQMARLVNDVKLTREYDCEERILKMTELYISSSKLWSIETEKITDVAFVFHPRVLSLNPGYVCDGITNCFVLRFTKTDKKGQSTRVLRRLGVFEFPAFPSHVDRSCLSSDFIRTTWLLITQMQEDIARMMNSNGVAMGDFCVKSRKIRVTESEWDYVVQKIGAVVHHRKSKKSMPVVLDGLTVATVKQRFSLRCVRVNEEHLLEKMQDMIGNNTVVGMRKPRPTKKQNYRSALSTNDSVNYIDLLHNSKQKFSRRAPNTCGIDLVYDGNNMYIVVRYKHLVVSTETLFKLYPFGVQNSQMEAAEAMPDAATVSSANLPPAGYVMSVGQVFEYLGFIWRVTAFSSNTITGQKTQDIRSLPHYDITDGEKTVFRLPGELNDVRNACASRMGMLGNTDGDAGSSHRADSSISDADTSD